MGSPTDETFMSEQFDIRAPDHMIACHLTSCNSSLCTPRRLIRSTTRRYHDECATILYPPRVTTKRYDGELAKGIFEAYFLQFMGDRNPDQQLLIISDIAHRILRWRFSFVDAVPVNSPDSHQVKPFLSNAVLGDSSHSEVVLCTATVDDVPLVSDNRIMNEFCLVVDFCCTTPKFNTMSYLSLTIEWQD